MQMCQKGMMSIFSYYVEHICNTPTFEKIFNIVVIKNRNKNYKVLWRNKFNVNLDLKKKSNRSF